jgi:hypothetical protein
MGRGEAEAVTEAAGGGARLLPAPGEAAPPPGGGYESMLSVSRPMLSYPELKHCERRERLLLRLGKVLLLLLLLLLLL